MTESPTISRTAYLRQLNGSLWAWADLHHSGQLDGGARGDRPPVLAKGHEIGNVLVPDDPSLAERIRASVHASARHRAFASLRSSQAIAQSVFGAIAAAGKTHLLADLRSECGRSAFASDMNGWTIELERDRRMLGEPRPTSIDVLLQGPGARIAVECKLTEGEFGRCSRPRLRPGDPGYDGQRCDGSYTVQAGRKARCALTEIEIRYWDHLPALFDWPADRDHSPCPFGETYQLARNLLAATLSDDDGPAQVDAGAGHVLVVYDARNPAFQAGGSADGQWQSAVRDCRHSGLFRRISWQDLMARLQRDTDLRWLTDRLSQKYGIGPAMTS